jgi:hypothetical protein
MYLAGKRQESLGSRLCNGYIEIASIYVDSRPILNLIVGHTIDQEKSTMTYPKGLV